LDCSTGQYALFILFCKKGVDGFYPSTPNIIEPFLFGCTDAYQLTAGWLTNRGIFTNRLANSLKMAV
ncbi:MAG TPA: hypothetical protein K8V89_02980, partial [Levilactobacillus brevis]|nr:hypothetical protein [Levilactobacillus brevis]